MPAQHAKNIALTPEFESLVDELVTSGSYKNASEVMRDALRALRERQERRQAELTEIQARIALSLDQANRGDYAGGSGEDAMRRAFETGIKRCLRVKPWRLNYGTKEALERQGDKRVPGLDSHAIR